MGRQRETTVIGPGGHGATYQGTRPSDLATDVVCRRFATLTRKVASGQVNFAELRPLVQDLYTRGKGATTPNIASSLQRMLQGVTDEDAATFSRGVDRFTAACASR